MSRVLSLAKGTTLKHVVVIGQITSEHVKQADIAGIELVTFEDLEARGKNEDFEPVQIGKKKMAYKKKGRETF